MTRRVAILSRRAADQHVWLASQYEFEDVVAEIEDVVLLAPSAAPVGRSGDLVHGARNRVRQRLGRPRRSAMAAVDDAVDVDLFFAVFAGPHEIGALPWVRPQLARSAVKVAYIIELWMPQLPASVDYLRQLRGFDHIFLFNRDAMASVQDITGVPCSYLPTAVDAALFAPAHPGPVRSIDVLSYGRRLPGTHAALRAAMDAGHLRYSYDTVRGAFEVTGHREHRAALAADLQRSRYVVVYKNNDEPSRLIRTGGEESLTNRYFEALASGAVLLGSAPDGADFYACFDWPDALVPIPAPAPDVLDVIAALDAHPDRVSRASRAGIVQSLRRHDWAHRWREVLAAVGMEPEPGLDRRVAMLDARAAAYERGRVAAS